MGKKTFQGTLYKLSPRTSIEKYHVLRSSAWSSWIPVHGNRWRSGWGLPTGKKKANRARRTSRSLGGIGLFDLNFLQLFLQPSRIDDRHGLRCVCGVRGEKCGGEELVGWSGAWVCVCSCLGKGGCCECEGEGYSSTAAGLSLAERRCAGTADPSIYGLFSLFSLVQTHERCCRIDKHTILYIDG